jgi:acetylornithine deacetylase/succinyl-diaminopimelate desuccinylase-like protein
MTSPRRRAAFAALLSALLLHPAVASTDEVAPDAARVRNAVRAWLRQNERAVLRDFASLLSIPNVASNVADIERNAFAIERRLRTRGFETRRLGGPGEPPVLFAERRTPGARRTIVMYVHYDGQPVDPARWASDPWRPMLRAGRLEDGVPEIALDASTPLDPDWRLYGRSTSDDKAPVTGLLAALDALAAAQIPLSVNLKLFLEGEEEAGSPHLRKTLERDREVLAGDLWLLCDGPVHQSRQMQVYFGARGMSDLELTVYGPGRPLHSGHYGNWAPNPAMLLAHLLTGLRDADGQIRIAGYYDDVRPLSEQERAAVAAQPAIDAELRRELSLAATEAGGAPLAERILLPALNVRGIEAGAVGAAAANAIPSEARASIDFRLVPDQTPERVRDRVEAHLQHEGWHVVHEAPTPEVRLAHARVVRLDWSLGYPAARVPMELPAARALVRVLEEHLGAPVVKAPTLGGSIPMQLFQQATGAPILGLPIANYDNNQHAANENIRLGNLWEGIEAYAAVLARLGHVWED